MAIDELAMRPARSARRICVPFYHGRPETGRFL